MYLQLHIYIFVYKYTQFTGWYTKYMCLLYSVYISQYTTSKRKALFCMKEFNPITINIFNATNNNLRIHNMILLYTQNFPRCILYICIYENVIITIELYKYFPAT